MIYLIYLIHSLIVIHLIGLVLLEHINFIIIHSISKLHFNIFVCARFWTKSSYYLWFRTLFYFQPIKSEKISWPQIVLYKKILASYCCIVLRTCFFDTERIQHFWDKYILPLNEPLWQIVSERSNAAMNLLSKKTIQIQFWLLFSCY